MDPFTCNIDDHGVQCHLLVLPLETLAVLPQPTQIRLHDLHQLVLAKAPLVEPALHALLLERVAVLPVEDQVVRLLVAAVAVFLELVVRVQVGNGLALAELVLLDDLLHAGAAGQRVGGYLVESAELVAGAVQQMGMGLELVLAVQGFGQLLLTLAQKITHL